MTSQRTKPICIAILLGVPLTEQNYERVGLPYLTPYFEVVIFDCMDWLARSAEKIISNETCWKHRIKISNENELEAAIKKYTPDYAIDAIGFCVQTAKANKILANFGVKFVVQRMGILPVAGPLMRIKKFVGRCISTKHASVNKSFSVSNDINKIMVHSNIQYILKKIVEKLYQRCTVRRISFSADIALLAGNKSLDSFTKKSCQIIWVGSQDFHRFNKVKQELSSARRFDRKEPYILFVDDCLASADDWKLLNLNAPVTATEYFPLLRSFFERLESYYGLPVVISGHPNSKQDENYSENMGNREVLFNCTPSLVLQSALVLIHGSTATSFAVLARKPILFLTTRELDDTAYGLHVRTMAKSTASPLVFMEAPDGQKINPFPPVVNQKQYKRYETNYLRSERSNESAPWQAFIDCVFESAR